MPEKLVGALLASAGFEKAGKKGFDSGLKENEGKFERIGKRLTIR